MARVIPTTKSCNEICRLITGSDCDRYHKYVQTTYDPTSTHALYGVYREEMEQYKDAVFSERRMLGVLRTAEGYSALL